MKTLKFILFFFVCLGGLYNVYADESNKVAVYVTGDGETGIKKILGDQLVSAFTGSGRYIAVERTNSFLAELRKEQMYQQTGAVDDRELSRLGIQFGVQFVCVAELNEAFGKKYVSCRLIDVESAEVVHVANETSEMKDMDELLRVSKKLAVILTGKTEKEKVAEAAKIKEAEQQKQKAIKEALAKGYIEVGNLLVTYPQTDLITWKEANNMTATIRTGNYYDWRLPSKEEALAILTKLDGFDPFRMHGYTWTSEPCRGTRFSDNASYHGYIAVGLRGAECRYPESRLWTFFVRRK